jgi:hypothetical protein
MADSNAAVALENTQKLENAIRAVNQKRPPPEIDFTVHTMEDGTQVSTLERVCKGVYGFFKFSLFSTNLRASSLTDVFISREPLFLYARVSGLSPSYLVVLIVCYYLSCIFVNDRPVSF